MGEERRKYLKGKNYNKKASRLKYESIFCQLFR
jgi:hypothetical protein